jgi:hypothetical protein
MGSLTASVLLTPAHSFSDGQTGGVDSRQSRRRSIEVDEPRQVIERQARDLGQSTDRVGLHLRPVPPSTDGAPIDRYCIADGRVVVQAVQRRCGAHVAFEGLPPVKSRCLGGR